MSTSEQHDLEPSPTRARRRRASAFVGAMSTGGDDAIGDWVDADDCRDRRAASERDQLLRDSRPPHH